MKKYYCFTCVLLCAGLLLRGQTVLVFKGTVKCYISEDERSSRGAKNVVVVPGFIPKKSGITGEQGYYEINTGTPIQALFDKYISVYFISSCKQCEKKINVFISADQVRESPDQTMSYITIPTIKMNAGCKNTELAPVQSDNVLNNFISQPGEDLSKVSGLNAVTAPPGLLNLLSEAVIAPAVSGQGTFRVDTTATYRSHLTGLGHFLFASPMSLSGNTGFNFSPNRDRSEAVFWNPSALAGSPHDNGINAFTNFKNNVKLSGSRRLNDRLTLGLGGIYTRQEAFQGIRYPGTSDTARHLQTLQEYAVFLSAACKINNKLSAGLTVKSIWQQFNLPFQLKLTPSGTTTINTFIDSTVRKQQFDADISFSYSILPALRIGVNVMNIAGAQLHSDVFALSAKKVPLEELRSAGVGLCYRWKQFNFGTDALFTTDGLYDLTLGANYVPFNNGLLSAGYAVKQESFSASFTWKQFRISYVDDNGLMTNEKRKPKSSIFNGRIYSGFVFDF